MNQQNKNIEAPDAHIAKTSKLSAVWLLPVIAAAIAIWLIVRSINNAGIEIIIKIDSADGIAIGKTELRYKGFSLGVVKSYKFSDDLKEILVTMEVDNTTEKYLNENTLIWLVKPEISLSGVSGLDTVLNGNYFEIRPEVGVQEMRVFTALKRQPPLSEESPGLHVTLHSKTLGSIANGSRVYYKQIDVGKVYAYDFSQDKSHIKINLLIDTEYADLVKLNSRFWNASGVELTGDLSGYTLRTQSLASIVGGGIAFQTPDTQDESSEVENFTEFPLYESFDEARAGIPITMHFPKNSGIKAGITKVLFEGFEVGKVEDVIYDKALGGVTATVLIDPRLEPHLLSEMYFWMVKPTIGLSGVSNLDSLLSGNYVSFRLGSGVPSREFTVLEKAPPLDESEPGLHLKVLADSLDSFTYGSPVFFKNLEVGSVQDYQLNDDKTGFVVNIHIETEYENLINSSSVFYEKGGIEAIGGLQSFAIKSMPLQAMLTGGLAFHTIDLASTDSVKNGDVFTLSPNLEEALNTELVTLETANRYDLTPGITQVKFGDKQIGLVHSIKPSADLTHSVVTIGYKNEYKALFNENSKIWIVEPTVSAGNLQGLSALITGQFLEVKQGSGAPKSHFTLLEKAPPGDADDPGLQLHLRATDVGSLGKGSPVTFKQMHIGVVDAINFTKDGKAIDVALTIAEKYRHMITDATQFYNASGFQVSGDLTGLEINTESVGSILRGGIAIDNERADFEKPAPELSNFTLYEDKQSLTNTGLNIEITFTQVIDIQKGAAIEFNSHEVGYVTSVSLDDALSSTILSVSLNDKFKSLAADNTQFWLMEPEVGITRVANTKAFFTGNFIGVMPGDGNLKTSFNGKLYQPATKALTSGLNLVLESPTTGSVVVGNPVFYRQIKVGKVIGTELNSSGNAVQIYINIDEDMKYLVNKGTRFYNASGLNIEASLFSGVSIDTTSIDSVLVGGIGFATPKSTGALTEVSQGQRFNLAESAKKEWLNWNPALK